MSLQNRIENLVQLGNFYNTQSQALQDLIENAQFQNAWFIPEFINLAINNISTAFCKENELKTFTKNYDIADHPASIKKVGIVMAGNIPLVGFHDLLCVYLSGHQAIAKLAQRDTVLMKHAIHFLNALNTTDEPTIETAEMLKGCDAYIATGSNNTARYFEQYFAKYAHIIRQSKTSVAILDGTESAEQLSALADDMTHYFGLGCRSVTKIYVPDEYNFEPIINTLKTKTHLANHNKFKNNFDYNLALYLLNNQAYMTDGNVLMVENTNLFSPIATVHYEYYSNLLELTNTLEKESQIQAIVSDNHIAFGAGQRPSITDYADGVDTMAWLKSL